MGLHPPFHYQRSQPYNGVKIQTPRPENREANHVTKPEPETTSTAEWLTKPHFFHQQRNETVE